MLASLVAQLVKNLPDNPEDPGSIPGSEIYPREGNCNLLLHSCLKTLWTEESGGLLSMESQRVEHNGAINTFTSNVNSAEAEKPWNLLEPQFLHPQNGHISLSSPGCFEVGRVMKLVWG